MSLVYYGPSPHAPHRTNISDEVHPTPLPCCCPRWRDHRQQVFLFHYENFTPAPNHVIVESRVESSRLDLRSGLQMRRLTPWFSLILWGAKLESQKIVKLAKGALYKLILTIFKRHYLVCVQAVVFELSLLITSLDTRRSSHLHYHARFAYFWFRRECRNSFSSLGRQFSNQINKNLTVNDTNFINLKLFSFYLTCTPLNLKLFIFQLPNSVCRWPRCNFISWLF